MPGDLPDAVAALFPRWPSGAPQALPWLLDQPITPPALEAPWRLPGGVVEPPSRRPPAGIPAEWVSPEDAEWLADADVDAALIDPADPPIFEAQATYLQRHGLLSARERRRLPPDAFEPESVTP